MNNVRGTVSFSLDNIHPYIIVAKELSQICPQDTTKMLGSTDNNSGGWMTTGFFVFPLTYYFVELYFIKRHVWKVKIFHKTIHKTWNLFKLSKQSPKKFAKKSRFMIFDMSKVTFDRSSTFFNQLNRDRAMIETSKDSRIFSLLFRLIEPKFQLIENAVF